VKNHTFSHFLLLYNIFLFFLTNKMSDDTDTNKPECIKGKIKNCVEEDPGDCNCSNNDDNTIAKKKLWGCALADECEEEKDGLCVKHKASPKCEPEINSLCENATGNQARVCFSTEEEAKRVCPTLKIGDYGLCYEKDHPINPPIYNLMRLSLSPSHKKTLKSGIVIGCVVSVLILLILWGVIWLKRRNESGGLRRGDYNPTFMREGLYSN
jgi:hypothetical protein